MNVLHLQKSMTELKIHQAPRGIDQKTIIQHILRFSDENECFQKFCLVCKLWKDAVETIRFNRTVGHDFFYDLDQKITSQEIFLASYLSKYLKLFRKLDMPLDLENRDKIFPLVLNNMKKLNEIIFSTPQISAFLCQEDEIVGQQFDSFTFQILQNSNKTLRTLDILKFVIPDISFPKLTNLVLRIGEGFILLHEFQNCFPKALKNMENLKTVKIELIGNDDIVRQHIRENYGKHCISGEYLGTLHAVPLKIMEQIYDLEYSLGNTPYSSHLEYAHVYAGNFNNPMRRDWDRYQDIFDQCINLKAIEFGKFHGADDFVTETLPKLSEANQEIWKERISYFQARGIRIANQNEIRGNENLRIKVAKEAGVTWRFHFW